MAVGFTSEEPIALYVLLDRMTRDTYRWDHHGKLVRFRYRAWPFARRREVPLRLIRRWQDLLERNGALPLDDYAVADFFAKADVIQHHCTAAKRTTMVSTVNL